MAYVTPTQFSAKYQFNYFTDNNKNKIDKHIQNKWA